MKSSMRYVRLLLIGAVCVLAFAIHTRVHAQSDDVLVLEVDGPITPTVATYLERGVKTAEDEGVAAMVVVLNTPGGLLGATLEIVQTFRQADVPILVYVGPAGAQAASAGSIITVAAHAAGMAPETVIGAASPVGGSGEDIDETLYRKAVEDLKATMRSLTERRGEDAVALAEAMIEDARAVNSAEALEAGLIDTIAANVPDLLNQLDGLTVVVNGREAKLQTAGAQQQRLPMTFVEQILYVLSSDSNLIALLLSIGTLALIIEISHPGGWVAGFVGIICLGLAFYGAGQLPVNWLGAGLIVLAFVLLLLEIKATAHGALALAGTATLLAGLLVLFNSPGTPEFAHISVPWAGTISLLTASFFVFIVTMALRARKRPVITGVEGMIGQVGTVKAALAASSEKPALFDGTVLVMGERWRANADEAIEKDQRVVVTAVEGFTLRVKKV